MANYYNKDLYKVLNVSFDASSEEIKASYRKLVRVYHPDVSKNNENAAKFKEIQEAYEVLINEESRKKYDAINGFYTEKIKKKYQEKLNEAKENYNNNIKQNINNNSAEPFTKSINNALDNLFYGKKLSKGINRTKPLIDGEDINLDLSISCFEAINGTNRKVNILHTEPCPQCEGRKFINGAQCKMCNGSGELSIQKKINVKIPKGVSNGSKVRVRKEGNKGLNGGKDGDLFLIINVEKHPYYEFDGLNILCTLPITPFEAVLGTEIKLKVPDGKVTVKIPPMTSSGQKLKISEQGFENRTKNKRGDVLITVVIKIPDTLSDKEKELYSQLKDLSTSNIRKDFEDEK